MDRKSRLERTRTVDAMKYKYNGMIDDLLSSTWLDTETKQAFTHEQMILQRYPSSLLVLAEKISNAIAARMICYGT